MMTVGLVSGETGILIEIHCDQCGNRTYCPWTQEWEDQAKLLAEGECVWCILNNRTP